MPAVVDDVADSAEVDETSADSPMYDAMPLVATPQRAEVVSKIMRKALVSDNVFMNRSACQDHCGECDVCIQRLNHISKILAAPDSFVFEVWKQRPEVDLAGIILLRNVVRGMDAEAHYMFFDRTLGADKTALMQRAIDWVFSDHGDWKALQRLTIEIPEYAFTLARHAQKKLGFGGPFEYENANKTIEVEGVKRNAIRWKGEPQDLLVLGLVNEDKE